MDCIWRRSKSEKTRKTKVNNMAKSFDELANRVMSPNPAPRIAGPRNCCLNCCCQRFASWRARARANWPGSLASSSRRFPNWRIRVICKSLRSKRSLKHWAGKFISSPDFPTETYGSDNSMAARDQRKMPESYNLFDESKPHSASAAFTPALPRASLIIIRSPPSFHRFAGGRLHA